MVSWSQSVQQFQTAGLTSLDQDTCFVKRKAAPLGPIPATGNLSVVALGNISISSEISSNPGNQELPI
jgi:hypothetical protein